MRLLLLVALLGRASASGCSPPVREALSNSWAGLSVERRAKLSPVVFHGLAVETYPPVTADAPAKGFHYSAQFWLISVYKSARELAAFFGTGPPVNGVYDIRDSYCCSRAAERGFMRRTKLGYRLDKKICDGHIKATFKQYLEDKANGIVRRVNVTGFYRPNSTSTPHCWVPVTSQKYYVIFAEIVNGELSAKDDATRGATADWTEQNEGRVWRGVGILPANFGLGVEGSEFDDIANSENLPVFENLNPGVTRVVKSAKEGLSIDELTSKLQAKVNAISQERSAGGVPAKSIRELEDLMTHPTWLTDTSNRKNDHLMNKNQRVFVVPASGENWYPKTDNEDQRDHIREVITQFHMLKPKQPITDNRITKFVFTHDADLATSRTVQQHNKEVEAAFMDFNKKLEETLNVKNKKMESDKNNERDMLERSFNRVVNFLDKNIHKLREEIPHKQVCRKHKYHSKDSLQEKDYSEANSFKKMSDVEMGDVGAAPMKPEGMLRFNELAQTRDGLENILLGLDRPRGGPYKRHVSLKFGRGNPSKSQPKKHN